jgi:ABC-type branched-subunit amino acid transport system substrate-binding protein
MLGLRVASNAYAQMRSLTHSFCSRYVHAPSLTHPLNSFVGLCPPYSLRSQDVWCSGASTGIAASAAAINLFQVSGGAESPALSDKTVFPNFLRVVPSTSARGVLFADLCVAAGIPYVGVIADWSTESKKLFSQPSVDVFADAVAARDNLTIAFSDTVTSMGTSDEEVDQVVNKLLRSGVRIVYLPTDSRLQDQIVCAAHKQLVQHVGPEHNGFVWMVDNNNIVKVRNDADLAAAKCTLAEWTAASRGIVCAQVGTPEYALPEPNGRLPAAWYRKYKARVVTYNTTEQPTVAMPSPYAEFNYDSVWMWALAIDKMLKGTTMTSAFPLSKLAFPAVAEANVAGALKTHLKGTSFDGASGRVTIVSKTQDRGSVSFVVAQTTHTQGVRRAFATYSQATGNFSAQDFNASGGTGFDITWPTLDGGPPTVLTKFTRRAPIATSITPTSIDPLGGQQITIKGLNFVPVDLGFAVTLRETNTRTGVDASEVICAAVVFVSESEARCTPPAGVGEFTVLLRTTEHPGDDGTQQLAATFSYLVPQITTLSRLWIAGHEGSTVSVLGNYFNPGSTLCRLGEFSESVSAVVVDKRHIHCTVTQRESPSTLLYVSNDGGKRWVSGLIYLQDAKNFEWFNGSTTVPVTITTIYDQIHIAAMIPYPANTSNYNNVVEAIHAGARTAQQSGYLSESNLTVHIVESKRDPKIAPERVEALVLSIPKLVGILGDWTTSSIPVALDVSNKHNMPMISYDARGSQLTDKVRMPYFVRTSPSNANVAEALSRLFTRFKWRRLALLSTGGIFTRDKAHQIKAAYSGEVMYDADGVGEHLFPGLEASPNSADIDLLAKNEVLVRHVREIKKRGIRVIFINTGSREAAVHTAVLQALEAEGCTASGYAIIAMAWSLANPPPPASAGELQIRLGLQPCRGPWCPPCPETKKTTGAKHDATKCMQFGFPMAGVWQADPACCSVYASAGCAPGWDLSPGEKCGLNGGKVKVVCMPAPCDPSRISAQAHDAMYLMIRGLVPALTGGDAGIDFLNNVGDARMRAMQGLRSVDVSWDAGATGVLGINDNSNGKAYVRSVSCTPSLDSRCLLTIFCVYLLARCFLTTFAFLCYLARLAFLDRTPRHVARPKEWPVLVYSLQC